MNASIQKPRSGRYQRKTVLGRLIKTAALVPVIAVVVACDAASVQLCGEYACVFYTSECERSGNCSREKSCESAGSIRDRAPRIINQLRADGRSCGNSRAASEIGRLQWDNALESTSTSHARDMAYNNFESFVGSDGLNTVERVEQSGIAPLTVAENIGSGPQTAAEIINHWLDIQTDCSNMLDPAFTRVSLSCAIDDHKRSNRPYWSLLLAGPDKQAVVLME